LSTREHLDAASLTEKLISCLEKYGLEYKENLVGQGYDGAAVMSGRCSGVQTRVKEVAKYAFYVHCRAHCLNLVIVDSVKMSQKLHVFSLCWKDCTHSCQAHMSTLSG